MTRNVYGVEAVTEPNVFDDWHWQDYQPADVIKAISIEAAKTVLDVITERGRIAVYSTRRGCEVRVSLGDDMGRLSIPFATLIDHWVTEEGPDEEARAPMIAALENALAKVRAVG